MTQRTKDIFARVVVWTLAVLLAAILLVELASGQELPAVPFGESTATVTEPHVAEIEHAATFSETTISEQTSDATPVGVTVPDPGVVSVSLGAPVDATESSIDAGVLEVPGELQTAAAETPVLPSTPGTAALSSPGASPPWVSPFELCAGLFDGGVLDSARATALVLSCDDAVALREYLYANGIAVRLPGSPTRPLSQDFVVGVTAYEYAAAYCAADQEVLESVDSPGVTVLRFVDRSDAAAAFALANPDRQYIIVADINGLPVDALKMLAGSNVVGVIVGHYRAADDEPVDFAASAADVLRVVRAIRLVSDAPVLLAVGAVNVHTRDTERSWADAFGDDLGGFDGFAIYGLAKFPAILEAVENPRELILRRMGLPDKPCILVEFTGTSFHYAANEKDYVEKVWAIKTKPLLAAMQKQRWRGLVTWSPTIDDVRIKADAIRAAVK